MAKTEVIIHEHRGAKIEEHVTYHQGKPAPWASDASGKVLQRVFMGQGFSASSLELAREVIDRHLARKGM